MDGEKRKVGMASDIHVLDWMGEFFGTESYRQRMLDWLQRTFSEEEDTPLNREVLEVAHLFVVLGWMERRLFSQQLARYDLTIPQFFTLLVIHHCEDQCTMGVLAERTHQCSATLTGIIDRLIKMGLVERQRDESDRRLVLVRITEHGRRLVHESLLARFEALKRYLMQFDDENRQQLIQLLRKSLAMMKTELENLSPLETSEHPTSVACP